MSPATSRDLPHGCTGQGLSHGDTGGYAGSEPVEFSDAWAGLGSSRGVPQHQGPLEAGGALGPVRGHRGHFGHGKRGGLVHARALEQEAFRATGICFSQSRAPSGELTKRSGHGLHMQEQGSLCNFPSGEGMSYPGPKQSLARAAAQLHNSPKDPDQHNLQQGKAVGRRKGRVRAVLPSPAHPPCPISTHGHHTWSKHTEHPPALRTNPSLRLQRHSSLQLPRTTLGLTPDTAHSRNTALVTRVSHPSPRAASSTSLGTALHPLHGSLRSDST